MDKFGDKKGTLIKNFVDDNTDFFREDIVIMDWFNVLEMSVKFENEEIEPGLQNYPKALKSSYDRESDSKLRVSFPLLVILLTNLFYRQICTVVDQVHPLRNHPNLKK